MKIGKTQKTLVNAIGLFLCSLVIIGCSSTPNSFEHSATYKNNYHEGGYSDER